MKLIFSLLTVLLVTTVSTAQTSIISYGSSWKYLDNGSNQGTTWRTVSFNDAAWATGNAQLGYGDGDEATVVSYGSNANKKHITTYFRKTITVADASVFSSYTLNIKRDDGAVVYINGVEVYRTNMPTGTISYTTKASTDAADDGNTAQTITLNAGALVTGTNVIAVEVHQRTANSTDLSFDLLLTGIAGGGDTTPPTVSSYSPADNATGVSASANLVLTFSETIQKGTGSIVIKEGGVTTQTIDVTSTAVTVSGNTATIDPANFTNSAAVNIEIAAGAFKDAANNNYAGIANATTWNFTVQAPPSGPQTLLAFGTSWKYLDNGTNQGTAWYGTGFSDAAWASGNAQLGYGDGDEATVVSYGTDANNKYITTYFRKTINVSDPSLFSSVSGSIKRDDGVAIYVNGTEVYRNNLAAGAVYNTLATLASDDGATIQTFTFNPSVFVSGNNVIAVEIHQNAVNSSDISFDLELIGNSGSAGAILTRGPYLQMGNQSAVTLRWRTDVATDSKIEVGTVHGTYTVSATNPASSTEHEVRITGLTADTKYFYRFGSSSQILQNGTDNFFVTAPPANTTRKIRIAAFGDCGRNDNSFQTNTLNAYRNYVGSNPAEIMLLLGDNAYTNGTDAEYSSNFFAPYSSTILRNHIIFPSPGNHDYYGSSQTSRAGAYYQNFTMPTAAECGGVASGTEAFYSYDWGGVHFLSLDSYGIESGNTRMYDTLGAQVTWIKQDIAANNNKFTIAYWHHPPHTKGSHNSDTETELINIRQNFVRILERYGVDIIICGHSHDYERSYLLKDYFSAEANFNSAAHTVTTSSGKYDGTSNSCVYTTASGQVNHGTVYVVAGSAGADGGVQSGYPHNAMPYSVDDGGMFYIEVEDNRLDAKFIRRDGVIADKFTIMKDVNKTNNPTINSGENVVLTASWVGNYSWSTGATTRSITVNPTSSTTYTVTDGVSCVTDVFNVTVNGGGARMAPQQQATEVKLSVIPTRVNKGQAVRITTGTNDPVDITVVDMNGRTLQSKKIAGTGIIETGQLAAGSYFIKVNAKQKATVQKFVVVE
ncbi:T9SS type A sorting domain-containing protein [Lacibacter luteus]|uniref:T9SS type A sorting domain-containing protein n=1 Tax=Lacibacter luteus TaxID=2508719 RepID=A0A4Q1CDM8_9BACT|nr:metallophosphoesterase [Lacibacter luteus]RXK57734.1 T9SS type A sorting domain-containing protein [Lacibacter luteus]